MAMSTTMTRSGRGWCAISERGFDTTGAGDYASAIDAARLERPELAMIDLRLPGQSGLQVVCELKALDGAPPTGSADVPSLARVEWEQSNRGLR